MFATQITASAYVILPSKTIGPEYQKTNSSTPESAFSVSNFLLWREMLEIPNIFNGYVPGSVF